MNIVLDRVLVLGLAAGLGLGLLGCNVRPAVPQGVEGRPITALSLDADDPTEVAAVSAAECARVEYAYRLDVLEGYYESIGDLVNLRWARREAENLEKAQTFRWSGVTVVPPAGETVAGADEKVLVENVIAARAQWLNAIEQLEAVLAAKSATVKLAAVRNVQERFFPENTYTYLLSAEIPPADLRPAEVIPEAEALYDKALALHRQGKGALHTFLTTDYDKQRRALMLFQELVNRYPRSTKIAFAAYYIGDIYKEYFDEYVRAVAWYERAWQWEPALPLPARFQAATVYDIHLKDPDRAVHLYREAIDKDPWRLGNESTARRRITELTAPPQQR